MAHHGGSSGKGEKLTDEEIEARWKELLPTLGFAPEKVASMNIETKMKLLETHGMAQPVTPPEAIIKLLESGKHKEKNVQEFRINITGNPLAWSSKFFELKGHMTFFEIYETAFNKAQKSEKDASLVTECCRAMKAIMNLPEGLTRALEWDKSIRILLDSFDFVNIISQEELWLLLAALCLLSVEAHVKILTALKQLNRIPFIMECLVSKNEALVTSTLTFVNALIAAASDTQSRVEIRNEFLKMNILDLFTKGKTKVEDSLKVQIRCFQDGAEEDLDTLIKAGAMGTSVQIQAPAQSNDEMKAKLSKLESHVRSLEFENQSLKEETDKLKLENSQLKANRPVASSVSTGSSAAPASPPIVDQQGTSTPAADGGGPVVGGGPPPPPSGGDAPPPPPPGGGPPPPPPPPGGGPPPPPPPPGGGAPPPPPPPGGGPPGPPPPPGGAPGGPPPPMVPKRPAKAKCKPNNKMRNFGWNKIADAKIDNTIWEKTNDSKIKIDTLEFESLFGAESNAKGEGEGGHGGLTSSAGPGSVRSPISGKVAPKQQAVQLLDPKRANNCEIMLRGLKMEPSAIKTAIMSMDEKVLTEDTLKSMKEFVPLPEEIQMLKDYTGDKANLGKAEKYFLAVMDIPKLAPRLGAMAFKAGFAEKAEIAKSEIQILSTAISVTKSSQQLFNLLELVLAFGNYMNGAGNNGGCYGFRINSLNKMLDVKSTDGKMTLIHYLYEVISKKHKEILAVIDELAPCAEASRLNIRETTSKVSELKTGFAAIEIMLADTAVDATFSKTMNQFASSAKSTIEQLESRSSKLEPSFKECVSYYGEPTSTETEDFFGALSNFIDTLAKAKAENEKRAAAAAKEAQSKALLAAVQAKQVTKKKGQIDDAIAGMKNGTMFRASVHLGADGLQPQK